MDFFKFDRSPSPCSSSDSDMPISWSSPCSSPKSLITDVSDSDSDNYSPICSEADNSEFPLPIPEEDATLPNSETSEVAELEEQQSTGTGFKYTLKIRVRELITTNTA